MSKSIWIELPTLLVIGFLLTLPPFFFHVFTYDSYDAVDHVTPIVGLAVGIYVPLLALIFSYFVAGGGSDGGTVRPEIRSAARTTIGLLCLVTVVPAFIVFFSDRNAVSFPTKLLSIQSLILAGALAAQLAVNVVLGHLFAGQRSRS